MTINEIKSYFKSLDYKKLPEAIEKYEQDNRVGVKNICKTYRKKYIKILNEQKRISLMIEFDNAFKTNADDILVGIDEAGRGPLAGPVVAAAVSLPTNVIIEGINDSKKLNKEKREELYEEIFKIALDVQVGIVDAKTIDNINILQATFQAMKDSITKMNKNPNIILVDGNQEVPNLNVKQHAIIQGDAKSMSISAASIIAKVTRDRLMEEYSYKYPVYSFEQNKGYGSQHHQEMIRKYGPSPIHRKSFIKNIVNL